MIDYGLLMSVIVTLAASSLAMRLRPPRTYNSPVSALDIMLLPGLVGLVVSLCLAGYWLGNIPWVKTNLSLIIVGIIISSLIPLGIGYVKSKAA